MLTTKFNIRHVLALLCAILVALLLVSGCTSNKPSAEIKDILTQKKLDSKRTPITVLVKYAFSINEFEKIVEAKFPNIDIIQVGNYTSDRGLIEYERRLKHDDLTDIVITWPLNVGQEYWADRLVDLSALPFTANYHTSMLHSIAKDGHLYYLPGPAQVRGILYNKTLFAENNWPVPRNFDEFVALCHTIDNTGIRAFQLGLGNAEVLDTAFVGFSYGNNFSRPLDSYWLNSYNQGNGSFGDHFRPALNTFQTLIQQGIIKPSDLNVHYQDRERMLFTRQCAMVEDSLLMTKIGHQFNGCTDEFALMPFFSHGTEDSWARLYMVCYVGASKRLEAPANKAKYDLVMQLLEYMSTPDGQRALSADTGSMFSSVYNTPMTPAPEIQTQLPALESGRYAIFPELKNAQGALREGLAGILRGETSIEQVIAAIDKQNQSNNTKLQEVVIGNAAESFTVIETGNFVADALRQRVNSDLALFLDNGKDGLFNGKGISGRIYAGPQTVADIVRILPDLKYGELGIVQKVTMRGADVINALEHSLPVGNNIGGWFYYFSGLQVEYNPTAEPGSRIHHITDTNGAPLDHNKLYSVAIMDMSVDNKYIHDIEYEGINIKQILIESIKNAGTIKPAKDGRFGIVD